VLFINAVNEVTRERTQSCLTDDHTQRIVAAYQAFGDEDGFARVVGNDEVREKGSNLSRKRSRPCWRGLKNESDITT